MDPAHQDSAAQVARDPLEAKQGPGDLVRGKEGRAEEGATGHQENRQEAEGKGRQQEADQMAQQVERRGELRAQVPGEEPPQEPQAQAESPAALARKPRG
jgi:hypothetical protein